MQITLTRLAEGSGWKCPECNITGIAVFAVQVDFADYAFPVMGCAACISQLGGLMQHQARVINKAPA